VRPPAVLSAALKPGRADADFDKTPVEIPELIRWIDDLHK